LKSGKTSKERHSLTYSQAKEILPKAVECVAKRNEIMEKISKAGIKRNEYSGKLTQYVYAITSVIFAIIHRSFDIILLINYKKTNLVE
jgi:uncharacterized coiled-coil DUF342 family protein